MQSWIYLPKNNNQGTEPQYRVTEVKNDQETYSLDKPCKFFWKKDIAEVSYNIGHYEIVIKGLMTHLSLPKEPQHHKRYLRLVLFKPPKSNIREFIWRVNWIIKYFNHIHPFGTNQGLPDKKIIELDEFSLTRKWHK